MAELLTDAPHTSGLGMGDILHALFKHKWKILICALLGFVAAMAVRSFYTPLYESHAKLLVRYVLERTPIDPVDANSGKTSDNVIGSEVEILTSWDLAVQVAEAIGVKRLVPDGGPGTSKTDAASVVASGLSVVSGKGSNIIFVSYASSDPELAVLVLDELLNRYFTKHLEVHRSAGAFDFVTQQTDQIHTRLNETEDALKALKAKAGIISYADSTAALSNQLQKVTDELYNAEEQVAAETNLVKLMEEAEKTTDHPKEVATHGASSGDIQHYQSIVTRLKQLRDYELDLLSKFTSENVLVKFNRNQIEDLEKQRAGLEKKFPDLATSAAPSASPPPTVASEKIKLLEAQGRVESLKARLGSVHEGMQRLAEVGTQIADLERNQELEIANYKYFKNTLEKARVDEALDPSKMPNISTVQRPSPPNKVFGKRDKVVRYLALSGLGLAVALTLLKELVLNHTVKRPLELENRLGTRLLVSIPYTGRNGHRRLPWKRRKSGDGILPFKKNGSSLAPWDPGHFIRPYSEAIRDRLGLYFELNRLTHKPKLVGVTSFLKGAGTSTLAAGLAAALSETGDGKVLLVDVNLGPGEVHPFFNGRPAVPLLAALEPNGEHASAAENLYLATVGSTSAGPAQLGLKKFFDMMPNLQASDFDYVIFDMPPLGQTSPTLGMAGFMDKMLLVVEGEKTNRDAIRRGYEALVDARDNVSVVFNKARDYTPKWLHSDS
ncbi:MAG: GumC family protein [Chthoniobacterales bacterium]